MSTETAVAPPPVHVCILNVADDAVRNKLLAYARDYFETNGGMGYEHRMLGTHRECMYFEGLQFEQQRRGEPFTHHRQLAAARIAYDRAVTMVRRMREEAAIWARDAVYRETGKRYAEQKWAYDQPDQPEPATETAPARIVRPSEEWCHVDAMVITPAQAAAAQEERLARLPRDMREQAAAPLAAPVPTNPQRATSGEFIDMSETMVRSCVDGNMTEDELRQMRELIRTEHPQVLPEYEAFAREVRKRLAAKNAGG